MAGVKSRFGRSVGRAGRSGLGPSGGLAWLSAAAGVESLCKKNVKNV